MVVVLVLPRPYVITEWHDLANAIVVTYRGGEEMGPALASLLFGDYTPRGKLPWQLPRSLDRRAAAGRHATSSPTPIENWDLPYDLGATAAQRAEIRAPHRRRQSPTTSGNPLYPYGAGRSGF